MKKEQKIFEFHGYRQPACARHAAPGAASRRQGLAREGKAGARCEPPYGQAPMHEPNTIGVIFEV
ncbi:hypothetical protein [Rhodoferax sp.]|uniref:hypothetical protein n=1 Tax=Rhodoferax sp. TaxID=50421 RepID=UPI002758FFE0|nr:hypothetical protein [Rhodoferax sp.]